MKVKYSLYTLKTKYQQQFEFSILNVQIPEQGLG